MEIDLVSLFLITVAALVSPIIAQLVPRKAIPETVLLLIFGMILGPHVAGIISTDSAIELLSDLGLSFLFLLAGYEIDVQDLTSKGGRHGLATWFVSFAIALVVSIPLGMFRDNLIGGFSSAIILVTTAFGTLVPIMHDRGLTSSTSVGRGIIQYGVWGEICPIIAMAVLLSTRATWLTVILLVAFFAVAVLSGAISKRLHNEESKLSRIMKANNETNAQMSVRAVMVLMIGLVTLSALFDLDLVLGAFAAGFVLRIIIPKGDHSLEHKLNGLGFGFFIPLFFIVSGMSIDPIAVANEPILLVIFIVLLILVRATPIFISCVRRKDMKEVDLREKGAIALYCTTALPLIVAVTTVALNVQAISAEAASVLIAAGGITVLIMPLFAAAVMRGINKREKIVEEKSEKEA